MGLSFAERSLRELIREHGFVSLRISGKRLDVSESTISPGLGSAGGDPGKRVARTAESFLRVLRVSEAVRKQAAAGQWERKRRIAGLQHP